MSLELDKQQTSALLGSLRRYAREELDIDLSELRAKLFLDYLLQEVGPFAYNRGVKDAEKYFRAKMEDLSATCFEDGLTYWTKRKK